MRGGANIKCRRRFCICTDVYTVHRDEGVATVGSSLYGCKHTSNALCALPIENTSFALMGLYDFDSIKLR